MLFARSGPGCRDVVPPSGGGLYTYGVPTPYRTEYSACTVAFVRCTIDDTILHRGVRARDEVGSLSRWEKICDFFFLLHLAELDSAFTTVYLPSYLGDLYLRCRILVV